MVSAALLSRKGFDVSVLERREKIGGACVTEEVKPGVKYSTAANHFGMLRPEIIDLLSLERLQLENRSNVIIDVDPETVVPFLDGSCLLLWNDKERTQEEISRWSSEDAYQYEKFHTRIRDDSKVLRDSLLRPDGLSDEEWLEFLQETRQKLSEYFNASVGEFLDQYFEDERVKAALATGACLFNAGPYTPGTAFGLLYLAQSTIGGEPRTGFVRGGMGVVTQELAKAARRNGAKIRTGCTVDEIIVENGVVQGVGTSSGESIHADLVVSNANPKRTFLGLCDSAAISKTLKTALESIPGDGFCSKLNAVVKSVPSFPAVRGGEVESDVYSSPIVLSPRLEELHEMYLHCKDGCPSPRPYIELLFPSVRDPSLKPPEGHSMSAYVQYTPYDLNGETWESRKKGFVDTIVSTIESYCSDNEELEILHKDFLSPVELDNRFGLTGGQPDHIPMAPDYLMDRRPHPELPGANTPITGLYLCGSGIHPGGLVSGAPGFNAAQAILRNHRRKAFMVNG